MKIKQGAACHPSNYYSYRNKSILFIVIHYTANDGDTAADNCEYFSEARGSSANYFVGMDGIYQSVPDKYAAWAVGGTRIYKHPHCRNMNSISIEMCSRIDTKGKYYIEDEVIRQTVELTRYLMQKYGISADNVLRHYDVWNKKCPEPFVRNPQLWDDFKRLLTGDDELMSREYEELKAENNVLRARIDTLEKEQEKIYHYWNELPEWGKATAEKLYYKGIFKGESESDLNLPESMLRVMVMNDRAGLYG